MPAPLACSFARALSLFSLAALSLSGTEALAQHRPDALLSIDMNRAAVVEKIVSVWGKEIPAAQAQSFKQKLSSLRADHLLAANLSGSFDGVLEILNAHESAQKILKPAAQTEAFLGNISQKMGDLPAEKSKALGDANSDLVYTPLTPCRLFDTRAGLASALGTVGGTFSNQQTKTIVPNGACGIPTSGVTSLFISYHAYNNNPAVLGVVGFMKPGTAFSALAGAWTGDVWVASTFIAGTNPNGSFDAFVGNGVSMTADMIVDVMGYFRAPQGAIGDITDIQTAAGSGLTGGVSSGAANLSLANSYKLPQACANAQVPKYNTGTGAWDCANDTVGTGGGGAGTVTNIATGSGLTGGPITTSGTIGLSATQLMPTTACAANQIPKWSGSAWACAADATGTTSAANAWTQGGNAFGAAGVIGTTDAQDLTVQSGGTQARVLVPGGNGLRVIQTTGTETDSPNVINGSAVNFIPQVIALSTDTVQGATVAGGGHNASNCFDTVTRTFTHNCRNRAAGDYATVSGGVGNNASGDASTVGGGRDNTAIFSSSTVSGGIYNQAYNEGSTVSGGRDNAADGIWSTVSGGGNNAATASDSTVTGGKFNLASGSASIVLGGGFNYARGNYSVAVGGYQNNANGQFSFAAGADATASRDGQFVWSDSSAPPFNPEALGSFGGGANLANTFSVRATGGLNFVSGINGTTGVPTTGCNILPGGTGWNCSSDRAIKDRIAAVSPRRVLEQLTRMPISTWHTIGSPVKQLGPMAQDFFKAFSLGNSDKVINSIDAQGVAFAAIQGLNQKLIARDAKIAVLERELAAIKKKLGL